MIAAATHTAEKISGAKKSPEKFSGTSALDEMDAAAEGLDNRTKFKKKLDNENDVEAKNFSPNDTRKEEVPSKKDVEKRKQKIASPEDGEENFFSSTAKNIGKFGLMGAGALLLKNSLADSLAYQGKKFLHWITPFSKEKNAPKKPKNGFFETAKKVLFYGALATGVGYLAKKFSWGKWIQEKIFPTEAKNSPEEISKKTDMEGKKNISPKEKKKPWWNPFKKKEEATAMEGKSSEEVSTTHGPRKEIEHYISKFSGKREHAIAIYNTAITKKIPPAALFALLDKETFHFKNLSVTRFEIKRYRNNTNFGPKNFGPKKGKGELPATTAKKIVAEGRILTANITPYQRDKIIYYTSFGFPQIMGFNKENAGFASYTDMATKMLSDNIDFQLTAWSNFVSRDRNGKILKALQKNPPDFLSIAKLYNGSESYKENNYDTDIKKLYAQYSFSEEKKEKTSTTPLGAIMLAQAEKMVAEKDKENKINIYANNSKMLRDNGGKGMTCWDWGYEVAERKGITLKKIFWNAGRSNKIPSLSKHEKIVNQIEPGDKVIVFNGNTIDANGEHTVIVKNIVHKNGKRYLNSLSFPGTGNPRKKRYDITANNTIRALEKPVSRKV